MRHFFLFCIMLSTLFSINTPVHSTSIVVPAGKIVPIGDIYKRITDMKVKDFQKLTGRKLSLKEKISFLILKHKLRHGANDTDNLGQTSFIFGLVAAGLLILGLFVPYLLFGALISSIIAIVTGSMAMKRHPSDKKALAGKLLGWITLGLVVILALIVVIVIATWTSWL